MKKVISLAALAISILILASCSNGNTNTNDKQQTNTDPKAIEKSNSTAIDDAILNEEDVDDKSAPNDGATGDFNGDGKTETCWMETPELQEEEMDCVGECCCFIRFSDSHIPSLKISDCIGGSPDILGDLDGNGTSEIGILPEWWTSCWHSYFVYTYANGKWQLFVDPIPTHCNLIDELDESGDPIIEKISGKNDKFKVHYSEFDESMSDIVNKTKTVSKLKFE